MKLTPTYFLSYFLLMVSGVISCLLHNLNALWYIIIILTDLDNVSRTRMTTLLDLDFCQDSLSRELKIRYVGLVL